MYSRRYYLKIEKDTPHSIYDYVDDDKDIIAVVSRGKPDPKAGSKCVSSLKTLYKTEGEFFESWKKYACGRFMEDCERGAPSR